MRAIATIETRLHPAPLGEMPPSLDPHGGGASCTFTGITRPEAHPEHGPLLALEYESAGPLAEAILRRLAEEIAEEHQLRSLRIVHALGRVPIGAPSVRIEAIADHRGHAFAGCRGAIDRLKAEVPVWKRECWTRDRTWSSDATALSPGCPTP